MIDFLPPGKFGWIHHRFLNRLDWLRSLATHAGERSDFVEIAEGDVCWYEEGGNIVPYLWHPRLLVPWPSRMARRKLDAGTTFTLDAILSPELAAIPFVIELKVGVGSVERAIPRIVERLEASRPKFYWIDSYSPRQLELVKRANPSTLTSLHTSVVLGDRLLVSSVGFPPVGIASVAELEHVDIITVTFNEAMIRISERLGLVERLGASLESLQRQVEAAGKTLVLGGIYNEEQLVRVKASAAVAAMVYFDSGRFKRPVVGACRV